MIAPLAFLLLAAAPVPASPAPAPAAVRHEVQLTPAGTPAAGAAPSTVTNFELKPIPNSPPENVRIAITQDRPAGAAGPGFLVAIRGWTPFGRITAALVGAKGKTVAVIPADHTMELGADGNATLLVPYGLAGLSPGTWTLSVAGASGKHVMQVQVPTVLPADATHPAYRLVFAAPAGAHGRKAAAAKHPVATPRPVH